ncbi:MAG: hypothetical protein SFH39_10165 [Candidatus Magnetobacterium sp. LHC-1]
MAEEIKKDEKQQLNDDETVRYSPEDLKELQKELEQEEHTK